MSDETLGYDCQGEALRAGDECFVVWSDPAWEGKFLNRRCALTGGQVHPINADCNVEVRMLDSGELSDTSSDKTLRKVQSGRDVFNQARDRALTEGNPDAQHEWTEPTTSQWAQAVLSGMPWTESER